MPEIIASVFAEGFEAEQQARRAAMAGADWIELRLDSWRDASTLRDTIGRIALPVLVTCRTRRDGGRFDGSMQARRELLTAALEAGAQGIDLEDWETWTPDRDRVRLLIRSYHNFTGVPADAHDVRDRLLDMGADVAKVVGMAHDLADAAPLVELMAASDPETESTVAFAMGRTAGVTRVLALALGAPFVYAALDEGAETAPGQLPIDLVNGPYRARELGPGTALFGLLGNPATHSIGPWIHNRALRRLGIDGVYLPFETARPGRVLDMLPWRRLRGFSVTSPHKETIASECHRVTPKAAEIGAVNTLTFEAHGQVVGHNTDHAGVTGALQRAGLGPPSDSARAVVLGGGGAARAAAIALRDMGFGVTIMTRSLDGVREFASARGFRLASLSAAVLEREEPRAVVHATPIGSAQQDPETPRLLPDWTPRRGVFVLDMVYRPRWTPLLRAAAEAGAVPVFGVEMFLTQAAEQIALFTGERPAEDELRGYLAGVLER